jgi:hypothetical protein
MQAKTAALSASIIAIPIRSVVGIGGMQRPLAVIIARIVIVLDVAVAIAIATAIVVRKLSFPPPFGSFTAFFRLRSTVVVVTATVVTAAAGSVCVAVSL